MAEYDTEVSRLSRELHSTALAMQKVMGDLQGSLREQQHMQTDLAEVRQAVQSVNKLLREGDNGLPLLSRLVLLEKRMDLIEGGIKLGRDWWFKVLGNLTVVVIIAVAGALLTLYVSSRGGGKLP